MKRLWSGTEGQNVIEYVLVILLVVLAAIAMSKRLTVKLFGNAAMAYPTTDVHRPDPWKTQP